MSCSWAGLFSAAGAFSAILSVSMQFGGERREKKTELDNASAEIQPGRGEIECPSKFPLWVLSDHVFVSFTPESRTIPDWICRTVSTLLHLSLLYCTILLRIDNRPQLGLPIKMYDSYRVSCSSRLRACCTYGLSGAGVAGN